MGKVKEGEFALMTGTQPLVMGFAEVKPAIERDPTLADKMLRKWCGKPRTFGGTSYRCVCDPTTGKGTYKDTNGKPHLKKSGKPAACDRSCAQVSCKRWTAVHTIAAQADNIIREAMSTLRFEVGQAAAKAAKTSAGAYQLGDSSNAGRRGGATGAPWGAFASFSISNTAGNDEEDDSAEELAESIGRRGGRAAAASAS